MSSSIKINSISIDLAGAANEIDMVKCDHFSIRGFVAETRERDHRKCWPFSEESLGLVDQQSYSLPSLSVPKFRWWRCMTCTRDIDVNGIKDCGHSNSRTISEIKVYEKSSVIPGNAVKENEDVNRERSQKNDQKAITFLKKVHPRSMEASAVRRNSRKLAGPEPVGNKRSKEKVNKLAMDIRSWKEKQNVDQAVTTFGSSEIAGLIEDTPPKAIKNHKGSRVLMECDNMSSESINLATSGLQRRKTRKIRLLSELLGKAKTKTTGGSNNIRKEESASKRELVRGRKRKSTPENNYVRRRILSTIGATSENASKSCDSDQGNSESTDSGFDRDPIKGKQKNRRFQVVDEFVPSLPCETSQERIHENDADSGKGASSIHMHSSFNGKGLVPCPSSTQRTEKKLNIAKKKKKKPVLDHGKSNLISFSAEMAEGNQVKPRTGPSINAVSQSTRDLSNGKRMDSLFDNRLASEGYFRKYIPQFNDKPVISFHLQDNDHVRSRDAEANCLRDFGSSSKSNTGEWLRTGVDVVDFSSNNMTNQSYFSNLRHTSSSTEVADLSCVLLKDASDADRKGKTAMVQEHHGTPRSQSYHSKENTPEEQNDDIPMEIVELMAKNQYERCLPDKEEDVSNKQASQETGHISKNALLIDLNETYDNGISLEDNNTSRQPKPCDSNARKEEHFPIGIQQKSLDFFPISQPYQPSPFGIFPPIQENRTSSIRFSGNNGQWLGNAPPMANQNTSPSSFRVLRACNTCQSVPHQYREASHPVWPPPVISTQGHDKPVSFSMDVSKKPGTPSQAFTNENTWNLNFMTANGKQKCGHSSEFSFGCKHAAGVNSSRSVDTFSSESSIPALHLLSLMDPRLGSKTPSDHHGNTKFTKRHFPPINQTKEFIERQAGDSSKTAYPTKQLPFDFYSNRFTPETSRKSFPIIPPLGTSSFSFQNAQASWSHHQEKKNKRKDTFPPIYNSHEKSVFASSNDQSKFQLLGASDSMMLPLKFHMADKGKKQKRKAEGCGNASAWPAWPLKNGSGHIVCSINRNPADFTIPEPGNVYMLTGENLKVRKRTTYKKKPSLCKQDALKQTRKPVCPATENA